MKQLVVILVFVAGCAERAPVKPAPVKPKQPLAEWKVEPPSSPTPLTLDDEEMPTFRDLPHCAPHIDEVPPEVDACSEHVCAGSGYDLSFIAAQRSNYLAVAGCYELVSFDPHGRIHPLPKHIELTKAWSRPDVPTLQLATPARTSFYLWWIARDAKVAVHVGNGFEAVRLCATLTEAGGLVGYAVEDDDDGVKFDSVSPAEYRRVACAKKAAATVGE